ncbi:GNAT family N-acetyltransferase [Cyanobium sp. CH-040]|uniref:GNAT family N-acetyltransferase n=1 Tax=Cyanobium sp. CH-040 TaxID=2823708 RepID=UPI0020CEEC69|nr:GNAT family N-acetyltransferase [Cyanobium sp. CH-040]MCP9928477.1 GNAT family N-acetyltransferase [Cyanobium sp. CH-040]
MQIRPFQPADWPGVWQVLEPVFRAGETFPHDPAISAAEARMLWVEQAGHCRRQGLGSRLCQHSLQTARQLGYRAMQFNLVVSTNTAGIRCWQANGFRIVGTLPGAFRHRQLDYADALVMFQGLVEEGGASEIPAPRGRLA